MSALLRDLWHDLREKRLWPIAAVLALAAVAVPVLLLDSGAGAGGASPPPPAPVAAGAGQAAVVTPADEGSAGSSRLGRFQSKDPFKPRGSAAPKPPPSPAAAPSTPATGGGSGIPGFPGLPTGGGSGSASPPASPPSSPPSSPPGTSRPRQLYTYEIDVSFGRRGSERRRRGLGRMEPLPSAERPLLLFLGTSSTGRSAVFLLDRSLTQRGEGTCKPSRTECSLLYLRDDPAHDLHYFTDSAGRDYAIRLTAINLVPVDQAANGKKASSSRRRRQHAASWPFDAALFADLAR